MKRCNDKPSFLLGILALILAPLLTGCGAAVPLNDVDQAALLDPMLLGRWAPLDTEGENTDQLLLLRFDETTYYAEFTEQDEEPETHRFRAYITNLDGQSFLNAQYIDPQDNEERTYFFLTYRITEAGDLELKALEDVGDQKLDAFTTSEALSTFVLAHLNDERLYGEPGLFRRVD